MIVRRQWIERVVTREGGGARAPAARLVATRQPIQRDAFAVYDPSASAPCRFAAAAPEPLASTLCPFAVAAPEPLASAP